MSGERNPSTIDLAPHIIAFIISKLKRQGSWFVISGSEVQVLSLALVNSSPYKPDSKGNLPLVFCRSGLFMPYPFMTLESPLTSETRYPLTEL
jgi:hypothetical protein